MSKFKLLVSFFLIVVLCSYSSANAEESAEPRNRKHDHLLFEKYLMFKPESIILYRGNSEFQFGGREFRTCDFVFGVPQLIPGDPKFNVEVLENEFLYEYVAVNNRINPAFDGFRLYKTSKGVTQKFREYLEKRFDKRVYNKQTIYVLSNVGLSRCFDYAKQRVTNKTYCSFLSDNTFIIATSLGYMNPNLNSTELPVVDLNKDEKIELRDSFFIDSKPETYVAIKYIDSSRNYPENRALQGIKNITFAKSRSISQSPFSVYINTCNDSTAEAEALFKCFDDCGYPKNKRLERVSTNRYILTLETDPTFFFGKLHVLLTAGYSPSLF